MLAPGFFRSATALLLFLCSLAPLGAAPEPGQLPANPVVLQQIQAILQEQAARTPAQQRIDSNLLYESRIQRGQAAAPGLGTTLGTRLHTGVRVDPDGLVLVDIDAVVTTALLGRIQVDGGRIVNQFPQYHAIRARIPLSQIEDLAAQPGVRFIKPAVPAGLAGQQSPGAGSSFSPLPLVPPASRNAVPFMIRADNVRAQLPALLRQNKTSKPLPAARLSNGVGTNAGTVDSEGDTTERAALARQKYYADGTGVRIGILSDSDRYLAQSEASGDLPTVTVVPGQDGLTFNSSGVETDTGEGTAMMEIVHDLAPGASLYFATGSNGEASMAANIQTLRDDGCAIIIDDVYYFDEPPFQDGTIAIAVNNVTAAGALYFSSAGNAGRVDAGTSTVWEGDYNFSGQLAGLGGTEEVHSFGPDVYDQAHMGNGGNSLPLYLFWSDAYGHAGNDYNLFVTDAAETTIVAQSTNVQNGTQDPVESCPIFDGQRVFITKHSGSARYLQLNVVSNGQASLQYQTAGVTRGHSAAARAFSVAATRANTFYPSPFDGTAVTETFSADGPRRMYYDSDGNELNPGSGYLSSGGSVRNKPDMTATDGVSTSVPGFQPFYGTSAAAPHAGAIAALVGTDSKTVPILFIGPIMESTAIDIMSPGFDYDSGYGIVDAYAALASVAPTNDNFGSGTGIGGLSGSLTDNNAGASLEAGEPGNISPGGRSLWYTWAAPSVGYYNFNTAGSSFDTTLGAYTGNSVGALTTIAANDDFSVLTLQSSITLLAFGGTTYHISVDGYFGLYGDINLAWFQVAPPNNSFAGAQGLGGASGTVYGSNVLATKEGGEPAHGGNAGGASVWYTWTAPYTGDFNFNTFGSSFDTTLGIYTGSIVDGLTTVAENDDADGFFQSSASFHAVSGTVYDIAVDGYSGATGGIVLNWQPLSVSDLSLSPMSIPVGGSATGTVTLNENGIQPGGSVVTLTSSNAAVSVPSSVTVPVNATTASFSITASAGSVGSATITATYPSGTSMTAILTVTKLNTAITVANVSGFAGTAVTLSGTLKTGGGTTLSGKTLTFKVGTTTVGTAVTNASGIATLSYAIPAATPAGTQTITASFAGDTNNNLSSGTGTLTVTAPNTVTTAANVSGAAGTSVTLSGTLKTKGGTPFNGYTLTFKVGTTTVGTAVTNASGVATLSYAIPITTSAGNETITVSFAGVGAYNPSSGTATLTVTSGKANTVTTVANVSGAAGSSVTLTGTLKTSANVALSGKTLTFKVGTTTVGTAVTNSSGIATLSYAIPAATPAGTQTITASFAGDTNNNLSSGTGTLTVTSTANTVVTVANVTGAAGTPVTLSGTLKTKGGTPFNGYTLTFKVGTTTVGTAVTNSSGIATLSYAIPAATPAGSQTITVSFAGVGTYTPSSSTGTLTVTSTANTVVTVANVTGAPGTSVTLSGTLKTKGGTPFNGYTLTFKVGTTTVGTAVTNASGIATLSYAIPAATPAGSETITVSFAGVGTYTPSTGTGTLTVS